jgi:multiple sugar transport system substrate-binding protein
MRKISHVLSGALLAVGIAGGLAGGAARADDLVFMSTQLRPVEEAQKVRDVILKDFAGHVNFVVDQPQQLLVRFRAEQQGGSHTISLVGALHGELEPLASGNFLMPVDDLAAQLSGRGILPKLMTLGRFGGEHQMYIPWMQASYIMVANKQALPFLPAGADINKLTYDQLAAWGKAIQDKTGKRLLGFPAGPQGLMHRFFEGYLYPSFTGGVVTTFRSPDAVSMWTQFRGLWKYVNPNSTSYGFMQEPLLSGDVWIAFDHEARMLDALRKRPDDFVAFPPPAGPHGAGFMPVIAGLAISLDAPDAAGAKALIEYLLRPETQILTARSTSFLPVLKVGLPADLDPGLRMAADAIQQAQAAPDAIASVLPIGLGDKSGEFDKVFLDTFQLIVLRGAKPEDALAREAAQLQQVLDQTQAPCWSPDPSSQGACKVK